VKKFFIISFCTVFTDFISATNMLVTNYKVFHEIWTNLKPELRWPYVCHIIGGSVPDHEECILQPKYLKYPNLEHVHSDDSGVLGCARCVVVE